VRVSPFLRPASSDDAVSATRQSGVDALDQLVDLGGKKDFSSGSEPFSIALPTKSVGIIW